MTGERDLNSRGRKAQRCRVAVCLVRNLLEIEVARSSEGTSLDNQGKTRKDQHLWGVLFATQPIPDEYHSCPGQAMDQGTSHPCPQGHIRISSKTGPGSASFLALPSSSRRKGAYRLPNPEMDMQRLGPDRVATTDRGQTYMARGSIQGSGERRPWDTPENLHV